VDDSIDEENTLIPPLILQPFVENSIWHGVAKKEGKGNIVVYIKHEDGMINCIVEDDGGGMKELKAVADEKKSLGMKITTARIDILNKIKNANASVNITNKQNGVRAEVKLPLALSF
jgi:LytS/YehU family sensor histidine kinase